MSWPPSNPALGLKIEGFSTFVWGTAGATANTAFSSYIVKSIRMSERVEQAVIENSTGLTAAQILLEDGINYDVTVVEDTNIAPPVSGTVGTLVCPALGANFAVSNSSVTALVVEAGVNLARKTDGERVITLKSYTLFTPA
jgi:hypothetical protein